MCQAVLPDLIIKPDPSTILPFHVKEEPGTSTLPYGRQETKVTVDPFVDRYSNDVHDITKGSEKLVCELYYIIITLPLGISM